jgi:hypothetical protein
MTDPARDPSAALLRRTRLAVGGIAVGTVLLALLGFAALARLGPLPIRSLLPEFITQRTMGLALIAVVVASFGVRRGLGGRPALRDPATRAQRFFSAHVLAAAVGSQAVVLGLADRAVFDPPARDLAPFWVAAALCLALAFPRGYELADFDEPLPPAERSGPSA